jgi:hypothetical protein
VAIPDERFDDAFDTHANGCVEEVFVSMTAGHRLPVMAIRGHISIKVRQQSRRSGFILKDVGIGIKTDGGHATADVTPNGCRVNQTGRCKYDADADISRQVDVRHNGDALNVIRLGQTPQ